MFATLLIIVVTFGPGCNDRNNVTGPTGPMPAVTHVEPNPTHANSVLIFQGTNFDQSSTFTLRQGGMVKAALIEAIFAAGSPTAGIQVDVTIPLGTPLGTYEGCVTTHVGMTCAAVPIEVF